MPSMSCRSAPAQERCVKSEENHARRVSRRRLAQGAASTRPRTDAELGHLKGLSNLEGLSHWRTGVTGTGFSHFKRVTGLQSLYLYNTQITDAGLVHLKGTNRTTDAHPRLCWQLLRSDPER